MSVGLLIAEAVLVRLVLGLVGINGRLERLDFLLQLADLLVIFLLLLGNLHLELGRLLLQLILLDQVLLDSFLFDVQELP